MFILNTHAELGINCNMLHQCARFNVREIVFQLHNLFHFQTPETRYYSLVSPFKLNQIHLSDVAVLQYYDQDSNGRCNKIHFSDKQNHPFQKQEISLYM